MGDDDGNDFVIDEVDMEDVVKMWAKTYAPGVEVVRWYYDPFKQVLLVGLEVEAQESEDA